MTSKSLLLAFLLLVAAVGCAGSSDVDESTTPDSKGNDTPVDGEPPDRSELSLSDEAQIYAAAVRQIHNVDHSFGEPPGWPLVYLTRDTDDSVMPDGPDTPAQPLSDALQEAITAELADQPFQVIWVDEREGAPIDPANGQIAEGKGIVITLGNAHPQDDGSVQLPFFMICGGLCGIGKTYVLSQVDGAWQVTGSIGPEIMS